MQKMFYADCSAEEYQSMGRSYPFPPYELELCPMCERDYLKRHGFYNRYLITADFEGMILIRRFICTECKRTVSLLPSFAHPKRTYSTEYIVGVLWEYCISSFSMMKSIRKFNMEIISECSRQLLRWYILRMKENLKVLVMEMTDLYNLRSPPVTEIKDKKKGVRQFLEFIRTHTLDISLKIFERSSITYLTPTN